MNKMFLAVACTIAISTPQTASAEGLFDKIDRMVSDVESSVSRTEQTINRAESTASRLNNKVPQAGAEEEPETSSSLSAKEQKTLERAKQIEDDRILREADLIRQRNTRRRAR